ncbi:MAG: esterase, partial [Bacillota bacterium]
GKKYLKASTDKPLSSMLEFQKLLTNTKPMFRNITCKTMVVQSLDDDTVYDKSADYIYKRIRADKCIYKIPEGGHMIFQSKSGQEVCRMVEEFIRKI